jgi:hypothetical protein
MITGLAAGFLFPLGTGWRIGFVEFVSEQQRRRRKSNSLIDVRLFSFCFCFCVELLHLRKKRKNEAMFTDY